MEIEDQGIVFRRMSITKFFNDFTEEVPGRSRKRVVQEPDFSSREIIEKHAGTITVTSGKRKRKQRL